jgi:hypothetical protein
MKDNRAIENTRWSTSCWRRALCCREIMPQGTSGPNAYAIESAAAKLDDLNPHE